MSCKKTDSTNFIFRMRRGDAEFIHHGKSKCKYSFIFFNSILHKQNIIK